MPNLFIISGCNGAGKTTASMTVLPETLECHEFVNCDEIAKGLNPLNPDSAKIAAARLMLPRIKRLIAHDADFAIETTLATKSYHALVKSAQEKGYDVKLLYFWLQSPELALKRVAERVKTEAITSRSTSSAAAIPPASVTYSDSIFPWSITSS